MECSLYLLIISALSSSTKAAHVLIDTFKDKCPGYNERSYIRFYDVKFLTANHTTYISNTAVVEKDIDNDLKFEVFPTKCKSKDALDTCETYRSYKLRNLCRFVESKNTPWSPFMEQIHPRFRCPIRKGKYVQANGTVAATNLPNWARSYWKVQTVMRDAVTDEFLLCNYMEFQIL